MKEILDLLYQKIREHSDKEQDARLQGAKHAWMIHDRVTYALLQAEHEVIKAQEYLEGKRDPYTQRRNENG